MPVSCRLLAGTHQIWACFMWNVSKKLCISMKFENMQTLGNIFFIFLKVLVPGCYISHHYHMRLKNVRLNVKITNVYFYCNQFKNNAVLKRRSWNTENIITIVAVWEINTVCSYQVRQLYIWEKSTDSHGAFATCQAMKEKLNNDWHVPPMYCKGIRVFRCVW